ncbi:uncharacterized protein K452DRAFT_293797 [Aplosporella prunicola CBS 121167]|uniref:AMP-dependent synthetase/ligase domain-containing protein n=1 Tax=Aplosporella prunicola CBS 121167 TaxID=1176127 RepID=A0A6A6BTB1_9PEZI|nr:uncharacterized protein K452DRAFT_293797 [Aplosporella prunicola CBS 121167]KAF2147359.1 hypothetical protein K452DRAFT_293797 [Aplosporella prunicola CBS 121167]
MEQPASFTTAVVPPGPRRLLTKIIDHNATFYPTKVYAAFPRTESIEDGFRELTYKGFSNAINRAAWWLDETLGGSVDFDTDLSTFAYFGPRDIRYSILAVAAIKTGRKILFPSNECSEVGLLSLMDDTGCTDVILGPAEMSMPLIELALALRPDVRRFVVPGLEELVDWEEVPQYPYDKTFEDAEHDQFMILHTSCTTEKPIPILYSNGQVATLDAQRHMPENEGLLWWRLLPGKRLHSSMELQIAHVFSCLLLPVYFDATIVLGPGDQPLTASMLEQIYDLGAVDGGLYSPFTIEAACHFPIALSKMKKLDFVIYTGGTLPRAAANALTSDGTTKLHCMLANNKVGVLPIYLQKPREWFCFRFHPWLGYEMRRRNRDRRFELVIQRTPQLAAFQGVFYMSPRARVFRCQEIFDPHPDQPVLWLYLGPADAMITFAYGGDLDPLPMEEIIRQDPLINAAIIGGNGRPRPFLLLELAADFERVKEVVLDRIWPVIDAANRKCPEYIKLTRPLVLFTDPGVPLRRTLPGTAYVDRYRSFGDYQEDIDELYDRFFMKQMALPLRTR